MKKHISVYRGDEYRTKVSDIYQETDFFYDSYRQAARGVKDIVHFTQKFYQEDARRDTGITKYMRLASYPNNIIAFCAGRGQGKTSAMLSFSSALRSLDEERVKKRFWGEKMLENSFCVLNPIDPTMLEGKESILQVIISRMFDHYERKSERAQSGSLDRYQNFDNDNSELLELFRGCFRSLDILQNGRQLQDSYDDLEFLADLGDSSNMKRFFQQLVSKFLTLVCPSPGRSSSQFLVIQIDDADLNSANAYRIVDELRKYCVVPNVIILMATDFHQLGLTVEQHFLQAYESLWRMKTGSQEETSKECHRMMERYLDKLIPGTRQIHLPRIENFIKDYADDLYLRYCQEGQEEHNNRAEADDPLKKDSRAQDYQDMLLRLIYQKTGLCFTKPTGYLHNLLPKTMRELTHMLAFLTDLQDIPPEAGALSDIVHAWRNASALSGENKQALDIRRRNIESFMGYLRHCWIRTTLTEEQQAVVVPAIDATLDMKVKLLLSGLREYGAKQYGDGWKEENPYPAPQYIDVINILDKLKKMPGCVEDFALVYASATILTLYMHLLTIQDLQEGLDFKRLNQFMGDGVFPPEVGTFQYKGIQYDRLKVSYDLTPIIALGSGTIDNANPKTYIMAQLFLVQDSADESGGQKEPKGLPFMMNKLGNHVSYMRLFKNCLSRTAKNFDENILTEVLNITLSWDLQYQITKSLKVNAIQNSDDGAKTWLPFEVWVSDQLNLIDKTYTDSLGALGITTAAAALGTIISEQTSLLAALAIGNPGYATGWWNAVKTRLTSGMSEAAEILANAAKNDTEHKPADGTIGESPDMTLYKALASSADILGKLNESIGDLVSTNRQLEAEELYQSGKTPQSVINDAMKIIPIINQAKKGEPGQKAMKAHEDVQTILAKAPEILKINRQVKECQRALNSISLVSCLSAKRK